MTTRPDQTKPQATDYKKKKTTKKRLQKNYKQITNKRQTNVRQTSNKHETNTKQTDERTNMQTGITGDKGDLIALTKWCHIFSQPLNTTPNSGE